MPTAQELKKAWEDLDAQIAAGGRGGQAAGQRGGPSAGKEEAQAAAKKAWREEEVRLQEQAHLAAKAKAWEEEQRAHVRKRRGSLLSETSTRWRPPPGRGRHDDGYSSCCQILPEVWRRRRGWKVHPGTRGKGKCRPWRRS